MSLSLLSNPAFVASLTDVVNATSGFDFLLHPVGVNADYDDTCTFSIATNKDSDSSTPTDLWKYAIGNENKSFTSSEGTAFSNGGNVSGATGTTLTLENLTDSDDYVTDEFDGRPTWVRCFVTHGSTTIRSRPAVLRVGSEPNE